MLKTCSVVPCEVTVAVVLAPHHQVAAPLELAHLGITHPARIVTK